MNEFEIGVNESIVARQRCVKGRTKSAATDRDHFRRGEIQQTFRAARDSEAASGTSAKRRARIGARDDQIVDGDDSSVDARGKLCGCLLIAGENAGAQRVRAVIRLSTASSSSATVTSERRGAKVSS